MLFWLIYWFSLPLARSERKKMTIQPLKFDVFSAHLHSYFKCYYYHRLLDFASLFLRCIKWLCIRAYITVSFHSIMTLEEFGNYAMCYLNLNFNVHFFSKECVRNIRLVWKSLCWKIQKSKERAKECVSFSWKSWSGSHCGRTIVRKNLNTKWGLKITCLSFTVLWGIFCFQFIWKK